MTASQSVFDVFQRFISKPKSELRKVAQRLTEAREDWGGEGGGGGGGVADQSWLRYIKKMKHLYSKAQLFSPVGTERKKEGEIRERKRDISHPSKTG